MTDTHRLDARADCRAIWLPDMVWGRLGVSELENSFCDQLPNGITQLPRLGVT